MGWGGGGGGGGECDGCQKGANFMALEHRRKNSVGQRFLF